MEFVVVDGVRLAVAVSGSPDTPPLVLLHGGGTDKSTWDLVAPTLAATHRVYAPDMRGFGDSDRPGKYSFGLMRDDVFAIMDAFDADRFDVIGHSMGGTLAGLIAEAQPQRVAHLVIVDSPLPKVGGDPIVLGDRPDPEPDFDWDALVAIIGQVNSPDPHWWDAMAGISATTLFLAGGPPSHVPQERLHDAYALVQGSRLVEIPVGHAIHRLAPAEFLAEVVPFLAV